MTKTLIKEALRSITANKLRFLSVAIIIALGMSFFVGINSASPAMNYEANEYFNRNNLMDVHVSSSIPFTNEDIEKIKNIKNVTQVVASSYIDGYATLGRETLVNKNGTELILRISSFDVEKEKKFLDGERDPSFLNALDLKEGRLPEKAGECVVDEKSAELYDDIEIGKTLNITDADSSAGVSLKNDKFVIVGTVTSPIYISLDRGQTKLGSGSLDSYIYVLPETFSSGEVNALAVRMKYSDGLDTFSSQYSDRAELIAKKIRDVSKEAIDSKLGDLKKEYTQKIEDKQSEIKSFSDSSGKQLKEKEASIKEFKQYVDNEDKILSDLKSTNENKVKSASANLSSLEKQLTTLQANYNAHVKSRDSQSSEIKGYSELKKLYDDLNQKHSAAKTELDSLESTYQSKKSELDAKNAEISEHENKISDYEARISRLSSEIDELERTISSLNSSITSYTQRVEAQNSVVDGIKSDIKKQNDIISDSSATNEEKIAAISRRTRLNSELSTAQNELTSRKNELENAQSQLSSAKSEKTKKESEKKNLTTALNSERSALSTAKSQGEVIKAEYSNALSNHNSTKKNYDADSATLEKYVSSMNDLTRGQSSLTKLIAQVESEADELETLKRRVTEAQISYTLASRNGSVDISKAEYDLKVAKSRYSTVDDEYTELKNDIDSKSEKLNSELKNLQSTLDNLANLRWTATPRNDFSGMRSLAVSLENIKSMSTIFPIVFFLTAMIACLVIMIKNVEEERKEIGVFKAFGYSNWAIAGKFLLYALLAWMIGIFIGTVMGTCVLPFVICSIYNMTYSVPNVGTVFLANYVFFGIAISLIMVVAATLIAVIHEIKHNPATLMRPKNIAYNRRHILEKFPGIWERMSYGMVVVARTISRSRERVTAGALGIACCTALILSSLGLINSTTAVSGAQYGDNGIFKYDIMFVLRTPQQEDASVLKKIKNDQRTENAALFSNTSAFASADSSAQVKKTVSVITMKNSDEISDYVNLKPVSGDLDFSRGNVIITKKMANDLGIKVGGGICLTSSDGAIYSARVSGIVKNYTNHYVYMTDESYEEIFGTAPQRRYIIVTAKPYVDEQDIKNLASDFLKDDIVTGASTASEMASSVDVSINRIFAVVMMFVLSACLLALIVMYTNSNVNLSERTREIANIKVIGLSDHEVLIYVIRESVLSTVYGAVIGLIAGIFLHKVLVGFISVDNIVYSSSISWWSYFVTIAIIALISLISSLPIRLKIDKINMAETLKEIE